MSKPFSVNPGDYVVVTSQLDNESDPRAALYVVSATRSVGDVLAPSGASSRVVLSVLDESRPRASERVLKLATTGNAPSGSISVPLDVLADAVKSKRARVFRAAHLDSKRNDEAHKLYEHARDVCAVFAPSIDAAARGLRAVRNDAATALADVMGAPLS